MLGLFHASEVLKEHAVLCITDSEDFYISIIARGRSYAKRLQGPCNTDYRLINRQCEGWPVNEKHHLP